MPKEKVQVPPLMRKPEKSKIYQVTKLAEFDNFETEYIILDYNE